MRKLWFVLLLVTSMAIAQVPIGALKYQSELTREAHYFKGLTAPIPMYAAQIEQESGWRPGITAWDSGRGLSQFMDPTTSTIVKLYPDLGPGQPYNPIWAMRALVRYDDWLSKKVQGDDDCETAGAALTSYNAGLGYTQQAQKKSAQPGVWFGVTELVHTRQSPKNFEYSRKYPHWILFKRQTKYKQWGRVTCDRGEQSAEQSSSDKG